jgi:hypothetical protein
MGPRKRKISMTNLTRATLLFLTTTRTLWSTAACADHGRRINDVTDLRLNVASAFLATHNAKYELSTEVNVLVMVASTVAIVIIGTWF